MRRSLLVTACVAAFVFVHVFAASMGGGAQSTRARDEIQAVSASHVKSDRHAAQIGAIVAALWRGVAPPQTAPAMLAQKDAMVYVALRQGGRRLTEAWSKQNNGIASLRVALQHARRHLEMADDPDAVELVIAHSFEPVPYARRKAALPNLQRGISGVELRYGAEVLRYGPTQLIASNRSFARIIDRFAEARNLGESALATGLVLHRFAAEQFLVTLGPEPAATRLFRGNRLVESEEVTRAAVAQLARRMADWMIRNVDEDGRVTYKYWPSNGRESSANNMIRQWMATVCLVRLAHFYDDAAIAAMAERNIRYNLKHFYRETDGFGYIEFRNKAKLGAIAMAALALAEHPNRNSFEHYEAALRRTIEHLWVEDNSFRTFYKPTERNDNQNFYPGEALVYLATRYRETGDARLLQRLMQSVRYYRSWHLADRNPAFVPWHSMAYALIWRETSDPALRDWIFEMNDWLLGMQQRAPAAHPDVDGRFYDPERPHFGPPHASSTGVYMEGLIRAYRVARASGDSERAQAYRTAIRRALRNVLQLEFRDEVDMFYISQRERVRGGLRTTVYDNEIRVDNVQHTLMAVLETLSAFRDTDFLR